MAIGEEIPEYASGLAAYHAAFAPELRAMVASLPLPPGGRVLDMACGDGSYSRWLAEEVAPDGLVVGVDLSPSYLDLARRRLGEDPALPGRIQLAAGDLGRLPFDDGTFDLAWCAQSFYSLPDPVAALRHLARVVRPGGVVAVLEDDTVHQVLLPWPVEVELALRGAELVGFIEQCGRPRKYYVGRNLLQTFRAAGLRDCRRKTWATDRRAPLEPAARAFLAGYLSDLRDRARPHLEPAPLERAERLLDPGSDDYLLGWPDLALTILDHVVWGVVPG